MSKKNKDRSGYWYLRFDGGSRGNPGYSAGGYYLFPFGKAEEFRGAEVMDGLRTNNEAEYFGLIIGLKAAIEQFQKKPFSKLVIHGDSSLVVNQVSGAWSVKSPHLFPLLQEVLKLLAQLPAWSIWWHPREQNTEADEQVNLVLDSTFGPKVFPPKNDQATNGKFLQASGKFSIPLDVDNQTLRLIKVPGGRDEYTRIKLPKLLELLGTDCESQILDLWQVDYGNLPLDEKALAAILRWHLRGMVLSISVRKVAISVADRELHLQRYA